MIYDNRRDYEIDQQIYQEMREEKKDGWHLASETLPDDGSRVLVYVEHTMHGETKYYQRDVLIARYVNGKWKEPVFIGSRVIAWKKLPEPPDSQQLQKMQQP